MRVNINGTANAWLEIDDDGDVDIVFGGCYDCSGDLVNLSDVNAALQTLKTGGTEAGQEAERPQQPQGEICPKCENPYPHSHKDGGFSCEECNHVW